MAQKNDKADPAAVSGANGAVGGLAPKGGGGFHGELVVSGRRITDEDIKIAVYITEVYRNFSRKELAKTLCCCQDWVTQRGVPQVEFGLKVLAQLEEKGEIVLPPKNEKAAESGRRGMKAIPITEKTNPGRAMEGCLSDFGEVSVQPALTKHEKELWIEYIERYHPEKYAKPYGSNMRYFVKCGATTVGCMLFSASAWALEDRDRWIGWNRQDRTQRLIYVVDNTRFLIFPWVKIHNLASQALGKAVKRVPNDWLETYLYSPVLLETFVDPSRYKGTCYKASNWEKVGVTKGRGRQDRYGEGLSTPREIYMYPLRKDFRLCLTGKKAPITRSSDCF